ncbi:helix-turn-helix domain-containing protein [Actinomyces bovis]|uniref:helix-turn-helix domain-containing protein n=1 Tax=Actinomyces bovis TaxID=1658 RepID=UPI000DD049D2
MSDQGRDLVEGCTHQRPHVHGTSGAYRNCRCRCTVCKRGEAQRLLAVQPTSGPHVVGGYRFVPALGSRRRLQALSALGWSQRAMAARLGVHQKAVSKVLLKQSLIRSTTARAIAQFYAQASWVPVPGGGSQAARGAALVNGWVPPLGWAEDADLDDPRTRPLPRRQWQRQSSAARAARRQMKAAS